jgi:hypothetical protein
MTTAETIQASESVAETWQAFDDDSAFLQHILSKKPAERLVDVPEWNVQILCRALSAESRLDIQMQAYDEIKKRTDFRAAFHSLVIAGCFNPATGNRVFSEAHRDALMQQQDGGAIERLAMTILRLSRMLPDENTKKN